MTSKLAWVAMITVGMADLLLSHMITSDVNMAIAPLLLGALLGLGKSELVDRPAAERQRKLRATEIALSPFTKLAPSTEVQEADPIGSAIGFGATASSVAGAQEKAAQSAAKSAQDLELKKAQTAQQKIINQFLRRQEELQPTSASNVPISAFSGLV